LERSEEDSNENGLEGGEEASGDLILLLSCGKQRNGCTKNATRKIILR
jgi:hypothetical protein